MNDPLWHDLLDHAKNFINADVPYGFTQDEKRALDSFFTNTDKKVFLVHLLPENMIATLLAMYSRLKNPRGLRGVFVDNFLPAVLASLLDECHAKPFDGNADKFLKTHRVRTLEDFITLQKRQKTTFTRFLENVHADPSYIEQIASSAKTRGFLKTWLDAYGHNSIARTGTVHVCCEGISILAAKSLEWSRPASAFIELSTRYVDMSAKGVYPIEHELAMFGMDSVAIRRHVAFCFDAYQALQGGDDFQGPLPQFFRKTYKDAIPETALERGVFGETCDVLGNLLPSSTLTSVGMSVSGEGLPGLIKHLRLDRAPENFAIAEAILGEAKKTGAHQFLRHMDLTPWDTMGWEYLGEGTPHPFPLPRFEDVEAVLKHDEELWEKFFTTLRGDYDKLPRTFEAVSVAFSGVMSFRGWRDLQRMTFCAHRRGLVRPRWGFYRYDKPAPPMLAEIFGRVSDADQALFVPQAARIANGQTPHPRLFDFLLQYPMALGTRIPFTLSANLREMEFCGWQRSDWSANHEVRQTFLSFERLLRAVYPWWEKLSRADMTGAYIFARGAAVPLVEPKFL